MVDFAENRRVRKVKVSMKEDDIVLLTGVVETVLTDEELFMMQTSLNAIRYERWLFEKIDEEVVEKKDAITQLIEMVRADQIKKIEGARVVNEKGGK
jgi:hypothetical protein